jgi:hypothetical protein
MPWKSTYMGITRHLSNPPGLMDPRLTLPTTRESPLLEHSFLKMTWHVVIRRYVVGVLVYGLALLQKREIG